MNKLTLNKYQGLLLLFLTGMFVELVMQTFLQNKLGIYASPIVWMAGGLLTCIAGFFLIGFDKSALQKSIAPLNSQRLLISLGVFAVGAIWCGIRLDQIFQEFPVEAKASDIIPSLEMYVQRLLSGETVYKPLPFEGYEVDPTYFPMLWAPFSFSEILNIDYRWTAYSAFLVALSFYTFRLVRSDATIPELVVKTIVPFLFVLSFTFSARGTFGHAVELLPVGFYLLLTLTIFHKNRYLMAGGILLCLLSRYAFTFWLPLYMLIYWVENGFKNVFKVSLYVGIGVLFLYIIPFLSKDWTVFSKGLAYYAKTATTQWETQYWQSSGEKPHHLAQGLSYAIYFYDFVDGDVGERLAVNRKIHIAVCALAAFLLGFGYYYFRKKGLNTKMYLLIGLKFYLLIFYGFFYVPFSYLYQLPLFLSVAILYNIPLIQRKSSSLTQ